MATPWGAGAAGDVTWHLAACCCLAILLTSTCAKLRKRRRRRAAAAHALAGGDDAAETARAGGKEPAEHSAKPEGGRNDEVHTAQHSADEAGMHKAKSKQNADEPTTAQAAFSPFGGIDSAQIEPPKPMPDRQTRKSRMELIAGGKQLERGDKEGKTSKSHWGDVEWNTASECRTQVPGALPSVRKGMPPAVAVAVARKQASYGSKENEKAKVEQRKDEQHKEKQPSMVATASTDKGSGKPSNSAATTSNTPQAQQKPA